MSLVRELVLKQADWPLGSSKKSREEKLDILIRDKKITLVVEKGTRKITSFLIPQLNHRHNSSQKHVCSTCKEEISDISRILIMYDRDGGPRLLCFHFFYPCWDMELLCQQYPNLSIGKLGFSIPENMSIKQSSVEDLQKNQDLWN